MELPIGDDDPQAVWSEEAPLFTLERDLLPLQVRHPPSRFLHCDYSAGVVPSLEARLALDGVLDVGRGRAERHAGVLHERPAAPLDNGLWAPPSHAPLRNQKNMKTAISQMEKSRAG